MVKNTGRRSDPPAFGLCLKISRFQVRALVGEPILLFLFLKKPVPLCICTFNACNVLMGIASSSG
jgi:hypothetical protein